MQISHPDAGHIQISDMDEVCLEFLRQLPEKAENREAKAEARLFPSPSGEKDSTLDADWNDHVIPELSAFFKSAVNVIQLDLLNVQSSGEGDHSSLQIPYEHLHAWIHTLNQARIALAATHDFTEEVIESRAYPENAQATLDLFLMNFYGYIQEAFIAIANGEWA